ncbi:MAG: FG-GAP-like repeat-containing protein [Pyrinomonadaceae bacterium]
MFSTLRFALIHAVSLGLAISVFAASGDVDTSFNATVSNTTQGGFILSVIQPDGKIIIGGAFSMVYGRPRFNLARLNTDGTLDTTFVPPEIPVPDLGLAIRSVGLQSDGKIIIAGHFVIVGSPNRSGIARLNTDGSPDASFNNSPAISNLQYILDMEVLPDNKIVYLGHEGGINVLKVLNPDGSLNASINISGRKVGAQSDGKFVVSNSAGTIQRYNQDLSLDGTFTTINISGEVDDIAVQSDGKILIGGNFWLINGFPLVNLARVNPNGSIDTSFNTNNSGPSGRVDKILSLSNGQIFIGGEFDSYNAIQKLRIAKLNIDGSLDNSFNNTICNYPKDLDIQTDGKIVVSASQVERLNADGSLDASFHSWVGTSARGNRLLVQPDGKILLSGSFDHANERSAASVTRFLPDGSLDLLFNQNYTSNLREYYALALQPDNKIIVGSSFLGSSPRRLNPDGTSDATLTIAGDGSNDIALESNGNILFAGIYSGIAPELSRFGTGTLNGESLGEIRRVITLPDTRILVAGNFTQINGTNRGRFARLFNDGMVDTTFNPPLGANGPIYDMALQANDKILIAGAFTGVNGDSTKQYLARLNSDGSLDTSFSPVLDTPVFTVEVQPDSKILIGGSFSSTNGTQRVRIARLKADGTNDLTFDPGTGANNSVWDIELQADGKIIVAGAFNRFNNLPVAGIVRLQNTISPPRSLFDFDGDGRADFVVARPSENNWYKLLTSGWQYQVEPFGLAGDIVTPADFDGDGKTDVAIFRPSTGTWWYRSSLNGTLPAIQFGVSGDIPRPSDFDGDGRADFVVFRPSSNTWYRYGSATGSAPPVVFGSVGDQPLVGDFDGDGKSDPAVFRPSTGDWWYAASSLGGAHRVVHWGANGDIPAPADFDGDGKTDFAVFRPSEGGWYVNKSASGQFISTAFGLATDRPIPADYDGDGNADIAVYRPSTGVWYLQQTTAGFGGVQWGISTDVAIPNAFVP